MKTCYIPSPFSPLTGAPRRALDLRNFSQDDEGIPPASDLGAWQSGLNFTFSSSSHYCILANTTGFVREVTNFAGIDADSFAFPDDVRFQCLRVDPANNGGGLWAVLGVLSGEKSYIKFIDTKL